MASVRIVAVRGQESPGKMVPEVVDPIWPRPHLALCRDTLCATHKGSSPGLGSLSMQMALDCSRLKRPFALDKTALLVF